MIKEIRLNNWKSFKSLKFKLESMNIIIGGNSSGKTNFLDALELLKIKSLNDSEKEINKIRGGKNFFKKIDSNNDYFSIICEIELQNDILEELAEKYGKANVNKKLEYRLRGVNEKLEESFLNLEKEQFSFFKKQLFEILSINKKNFKNIHDKKFEEVLASLGNDMNLKEEYLNLKKEYFSNLTILDPIPREIKGETKNNGDIYISKDCKNIISCICNSPKKEEIEEELKKYLKKLLGKNIIKVEFKHLGNNNELTQLYLTEIINNNKIELHSDIISDGTLRFIAIIGAMLLQKKHTLLAIEEIDNGIAPSKTQLLLEIVDDISLEKDIDIVITTHNTTLMNYISDNLFNFIYFAYRDLKNNSKIIRIKDIPRINKLMSYGDIGDLMESNKILNFLDESNDSPPKITTEMKEIKEILMEENSDDLYYGH